MAEVNGLSSHEDTVSVSTSHLGKRKRTASPEPATAAPVQTESPLQTALQDLLRHFRKHDSSPSLLKYPVPASATEIPELKRARLSKAGGAINTIEDRLLAGAYGSLDAVKEDMAAVKKAILESLTHAGQGGTTDGDTGANLGATPGDLQLSRPELEEQWSKLTNVLETAENGTSLKSEGGDDMASIPPVNQPSHRFISLRGHLVNGAHMLYSGLSTRPLSESDETEKENQYDQAHLPNGFEMTEFASLGAVPPRRKDESRRFGTIFRPGPEATKRPLEMSRRTKTSPRGLRLEFVPHEAPSEEKFANRDEFKFAKLPTGQWLSYGVPAVPSDRAAHQTHQPPGSVEQKMSQANKGRPPTRPAEADDLFGSIYSSFAPSSDNSNSIFSDCDRSRHWWHQYGQKKLSTIYKATAVADGAGGRSPSQAGHEANGDFEELVATYEQPTDPSELADAHRADTDGADVLEEVSELIETLSSYQRNRTLDATSDGVLPQPSSAESDLYQLLKTQLNLLVSSLPPFAVAKLNGDQLEELNISTNMVVAVPEYPGTGQIDEYAYRKQKMSQQATTAASRTAATPQGRPGYTPQANSAAYNAQARNYNAATPAAAAYGMRAAQNYSTPVPRPVYSQNPYQSSSNPYVTRPSVQQFQRPVQNGYYGATPTPVQTSGFVQRPSQPGYQQRAQDTALMGRSGSPQKPMVNGQHYAARAYHQPPPTPQAPYSPARPGSGPPATPPPAASAVTYSRLNGVPDRPGGDGSHPGASAASHTQAPAPAHAQAPVQAQAPTPTPAPAQAQAASVEVSR